MNRGLAALAVLTILSAPLAAQSSALSIEVLLPATATPGVAAPTSGASVVTANVLADAKTRELLRNGFPAQIRYRLELWREGRWVDDLERATEWAVLVSYDPATQTYRAVRRHGNEFEDFGVFATAAAAEAAFSRPYRVSLAPRRRARYYYSLAVDVQTLSVSDLDELQRWLRGEFQPAVRGRNSVGNAMRTGVGTLMSRLLGGEKRHYERRSPSFVPG